ncbi:MAG: glutamate 5-kinase [Sedimentibacter saalensis]|uniref:glutamate 5-kinase n=1 Tax=Sedimentibacter saalensis TaxID=130788 RepID=UPI002B1ED1ED|nr:glutamate 5-kinase [Sedimentibacter saalensis]MEA5095650.1 glutamate 5-kinase [Sedimentibacter saalensis]
MKINNISDKRHNRIVVKVGSSTLTHDTGKLNLRMMDKIAMVLSDIKNEGTDVVLVTSAAVAAGVSKLGLKERPKTTKEKQAAASVGQCELMFAYDKVFSQYNQTVSQLLLTRDITENPLLKENVTNTFETLFTYNVIPIVNENDSVAIEELVYGDNDTLSAVTAKIVCADLLIILSDIDGLYDSNPQNNPDAKLIPVVREITEEIEGVAGGSQSLVGTGGMATKIAAAKIAVASGIDMAIVNGKSPELIYDVLDGKAVGTLFLKKESK